MPAGQARVLLVCTGNVCRSPLAMLRLQALLGDAGSAITVESAGTRALVGEPMSAGSAVQARELGLDPSAFSARAVTAEMIADADLVLTAALSHRSEVVSMHVPALRYAFALLELDRLLRLSPLPDLADSPAERLRALAQLGTRRRGQTPPVAPGGDDVLDPYGGPARAYRTATQQLVPAVDSLAAVLSGTQRTTALEAAPRRS